MKNKFVNLFFKFSFGGLISAVISFISTPIITAIVLPEEFGKASMFVLAFNFLLQLTLSGSDQSFVRFFYQDKYKTNTSRLLINSIFVPLGLAFIFIVFILMFWKPISMSLIGAEKFNVAILLSLVLLFSLIERFSTLLIRMSQKAILFSNLKIIQSLTNAIIVIVYAHFIDNSFLGIIYGNLCAVIIITVIGVFIERKFWFKNIYFNKVDILDIVKYGLPFIPTFIISWIFDGIDKMSLRYYSNFTEIGLYSAALKIVAILSILQVTFSNFWVPIAYQAYEDNSTESKKLFEIAFVTLSVIFFLASIIIIASKDLIIRLFAKDYLQAADIVPFLVFIPIMYTLSEITVGGINFKKKTYWHLAISIIAAIINILGVFVLVPMLGARGAAISTGIAYIGFFYARTIISNYYFPLNFQAKKTFVSICVLLIIAFINMFSKNIYVCLLSNIMALIVIVLLYIKQLHILYYNFFNKRLQ